MRDGRTYFLPKERYMSPLEDWALILFLAPAPPCMESLRSPFIIISTAVPLTKNSPQLEESIYSYADFSPARFNFTSPFWDVTVVLIPKSPDTFTSPFLDSICSSCAVSD